MDGPTIDGSLLTPLFVMAIAMALLYFLLLLMAMRNEIFRRRVRTLELTAAGQAG
jgi:heme exporter protein C